MLASVVVAIVGPKIGNEFEQISTKIPVRILPIPKIFAALGDFNANQEPLPNPKTMLGTMRV